MNLLFCIDRYCPSRGGAEKYLHDLARALHQRGHRIRVAALEAEEDGVVDRILVKAPVFPRWLREFMFALRISRMTAGQDVDRTMGFRHVLSVDRFQPHEGLFIDALLGSLRPFSKSPFLQRLLFLRKLLSLKNQYFLYADRTLFKRKPGLKVAALAQSTARSILKRHGDTRPRVRVIPNGVDRSQYHPGLRELHGPGLRRELGIPPSRRVLFFVAHNFRLKGLWEAIHGMHLYLTQGGDPVLVVAGRGRGKRYRKLSKRLGLEDRVLFLGDQEEMEPLYGLADVLVHPTFYDHCSLVVLESLGAGVPVITTKHNGASELMADGRAGFVIDDPRDHEAMARALRKILDEGRYEQYRDEAIKLGARYDFQEHVERMEQWILED